MSNWSKSRYGGSCCHNCPDRVVTEDGKVCEKDCEKKQAEHAMIRAKKQGIYENEGQMIDYLRCKSRKGRL